MKILYIGGTGEISYACVQAGAKIGQEITVFNRGDNDEPLPAGVKRIVGQLDDDQAYRQLGEGGFDVVCQFLAYDVNRVRRDLEVFGGKISQYVFISSSSAYLKPPSKAWITEDVPLVNPYWPYSQAKARIEKELMGWHQAGKLPVTIVRPSHTYRRQWPGTFYGNDDLAWRIAKGRPTIVQGDGSNLWMLTHSRDFAVPFVRLLGNEQALGEAYHITGDEANNWNQILQAIGTALGVEPKLVHVPSETLVKYDPNWAGPLLGDKSWSLLYDNSKVKAVAGDFPVTVAMAEGMKMVAEHWKQRAGRFQLDEQRHALLDRIAADQSHLGT